MKLYTSSQLYKLLIKNYAKFEKLLEKPLPQITPQSTLQEYEDLLITLQEKTTIFCIFEVIFDLINTESLKQICLEIYGPNSKGNE